MDFLAVLLPWLVLIVAMGCAFHYYDHTHSSLLIIPFHHTTVHFPALGPPPLPASSRSALVPVNVRLSMALKDWALPVGVLAVLWGAVHLVLRRPYPLPPPGNRAIVVVSGMHGWIGVGHSLPLPPSRPPRTRPPSLTGASTGIGRHAAEHLARLGFTVLAGVRREADMAALQSAHLPTLHPIILDVTKPADVQAAVAHAKALAPLPVWGLVNNAGLGYPIPMELADRERVRQVYEVNVLAIIDMTKAFAPLLRAAPGGRIVNVGSATGTMAAQCDGIYASSKHAVEGLTDSLRLELSAWDMSVSLLVPGQVKSNMWGKLTGHNAPAEQELTPEQYALYKPLFQQVGKAVSGFLPRLSPASVTSEAIAHALTSPYPKTRYLVANVNGVPLWLLRGLCGLLPDRLVDFMKLNL